MHGTRTARYRRYATLAAGAALTGAAVAAARPPARRNATAGATARLDGRAALVTGGSRGLGLLLARELGARGCAVVICARDQAELDRASADLAERGVCAHAIRCDLRDAQEVQDMVRDAAARFGRLDLVVNNAGVIQVGTQQSLTEEHFAEAMGTMFWAPLRVARAALPDLRATGGRLVTITSIGGELSAPHLLPYSCAKFAAVALSEGLAAESAGTGVPVTTVVPGFMRTGSHRRAVFAGRPEREYAWFALGASLPGISMDGERAARHIVDAVVRGRGHVVLTPQARAALALHGLLPGTTQALLGWVNRLLPRPGGEAVRTGLLAGELDRHPLLRPLTVLNDRASRRFNQLPDGPRRAATTSDQAAGRRPTEAAAPAGPPRPGGAR